MDRAAKTMEYRGYTGSVEYSDEDGLYFGKVLEVRSLISYEGEMISELIADFHDAIDGYLEFCAEEGEEPERPQPTN